MASPSPLDTRFLFAIVGSLAIHAAVLALTGLPVAGPSRKSEAPKIVKPAITLDVLPRDSTHRPAKPPPRIAPRNTPAAVIATPPRQPPKTPAATPQAPLATQPAPPAPTPEEWAFAGTYTLKNSKGYRYMWGKQVRSMMGTAVAGKDAGEVRFRLEIAPDGSLARLETLWSTSQVAEQLARKAIASMPRWPPTPTGQPLIFERTVAFTPFASDWPPIYDDDCLPDPPAFTNPYAWDGKSPQVVPPVAKPAAKPDPKAYEECLKQLPQNSIEAEVARDRRLQNQWGADTLGE